MQEIIEKFKQNAEFTTAKVEVIKEAEVSEFVSKLICDEENILVSLANSEFLQTLPQSINYIQMPTNNDLKNVKICLTDSVCGISETGSIVINNDGYGSYFTMLSQKHIVIINSKNLYQKPRDIFQNSPLSNSSTFSLITGPSATADMGSLVRGVHGPERLLIIVSVEDE